MAQRRFAAEHGIRLSSHQWPETSSQLLSVTPTAHWLEYADCWNPILADPLRIEKGLAYPTAGPGSGVTWNEKAVARFLC